MYVLYTIFILSMLGIGNAILLTVEQKIEPQKTFMITEPPENKYFDPVSASGIIEAYGDNTAITPSVEGLIQEIYVHVGQYVEKDTPLFYIDDRVVLREIAIEKANIQVLEAQIKKLSSQLTRLQSISDPRIVSVEELQNKEADLDIIKMELNLSNERLKTKETILDLHTVRAPINGYVLRNNYRKGEFARSSYTNELAPFIFGPSTKLQARLDIDEQLIYRIKEHQHAIGYTKGAGRFPIKLQFLRIEPLVSPKKSLTAASDERTDTRVLQVIYEIELDSTIPLFPGQQIDAYIDAPKPKNSENEERA